MSKLPRVKLVGNMSRRLWCKARLAIKRYHTNELCYVRRCASPSSTSLTSPLRVYIGPSIEGPDVEYILRVSGKVSDRLPSYVLSRKQRLQRNNDVH